MCLSIETLHDQFIKNKATDDAYRNIGVVISKKTFNFSQVMYENVEKTNKGMNGYDIYVSGFIPENRIIFDAMLILLYDCQELAPVTTLQYMNRLIQYIDWLRENKQPMPLSFKNARNAYIEYSAHLQRKVKNGAANHGSRVIQTQVLKLLEALHPDRKKELSERVPRIPSHEPNGLKVKNPTTVDDGDLDYALTYYYRFFHQVTDFLLENQPFPHIIGLTNFKAVLSGLSHKPVIPEGYNTRAFRATRILDTSTGHIFNDDEIRQVCEREEDWNTLTQGKKNARIQKAIVRRNELISHIQVINTNKRHPERMRLASNAQKAFFMLFAGITGQNDSIIANLDWGEDDNFQVEKDTKNFVTIKPRARYKKINFSIQRLVINSFRKYLKLRRYLLNGHACDSLFFTGHSENAGLAEYEKTGLFGMLCYDTHKNIDSHLPSIRTRKFRVAKNKWVLHHVNGDYWIAAAIAGNTPAVNIIYYHGKSDGEKNGELDNFLELLMTQKVKKNTSKSENSSKGHCTNFLNPMPDSTNILFEPDCNNLFYCFFCKNYGIYPTEDDIHKLMSLKYIIERITSNRAKNETHFQRVMGPVLERILVLFDIMKKKHNAEALIKSMEVRVFQHQDLHWYWEIKLQQLWKIGAL